MICAYTFPMEAHAFLPMLPGAFAFRQGKGRSKDKQTFQLEVTSLGELPVHSGQLVIADPFIGLRHNGNSFVHIPAGNHVLGQTWAHPKEGEDSARVAYLSLILDRAKLGLRRKWQQGQLAKGLDPSIPPEQLRLLHLTTDGRPLSPHEALPEALVSQAGLSVRSGTVSMSDLTAIQYGLPPDLLTDPQCTEAVDWYDHYQAHDVPGSWLDSLDEVGVYRQGAANLGLPHDTSFRLALSYAGWSEHAYPVVGEYAEGIEGDQARPADHLIAVHIDLRVLPHPSPLRAFPSGWAP